MGSNSGDTGLLIFLIMFWTFLTIFSNVFQNYLDSPLSDSITTYRPDDAELEEQPQNIFQKFIDGLYSTLENIPVINLLLPLIKLMTFGYSTTIPPLITIFLAGLSILTYYSVWAIIRK